MGITNKSRLLFIARFHKHIQFLTFILSCAKLSFQNLTLFDISNKKLILWPKCLINNNFNYSLRVLSKKIQSQYDENTNSITVYLATRKIEENMNLISNVTYENHDDGSLVCQNSVNRRKIQIAWPVWNNNEIFHFRTVNFDKNE